MPHCQRSGLWGFRFCVQQNRHDEHTTQTTFFDVAQDTVPHEGAWPAQLKDAQSDTHPLTRRPQGRCYMHFWQQRPGEEVESLKERASWAEDVPWVLRTEKRNPPGLYVDRPSIFVPGLPHVIICTKSRALKVVPGLPHVLYHCSQVLRAAEVLPAAGRVPLQVCPTLGYMR